MLFRGKGHSKTHQIFVVAHVTLCSAHLGQFNIVLRHRVRKECPPATTGVGTFVLEAESGVVQSGRFFFFLVWLQFEGALNTYVRIPHTYTQYTILL